MKIRHAVIAMLGAAALPVLANSGVTFANNEAGYTTHPMPSTKTRAQVMAELQAWKRNPVTADGWREVNGDVGWVYVGTTGSTKTRAAVIEELMQAKRNPLSADGWLNVGGEAGVVFVGAPSAGTVASPVTAAARRP